MVLIVDADYNEETKKGHVGGIIATSPIAQSEAAIVTAFVQDIEPYIPGQFYKRELKCVEAIMSKALNCNIDLIIVDGYADSGTRELALGTYVYNKYHIPVIGIAKNKYAKCMINNTEVYRGLSKKPVYVTSIGMDNEYAKEIVKRMYGEYRIPYFVKLADKVARDWRIIT